MNEVKSPKKPLLYYYFVAMLLVMLFNFIAMPWISEHQIKDVDYNTFVTMTEQGEVGRVEIQEQSNRILFTSSDEKTVYKTAMVPDDGLVQRLLDAGVSTTGEEIEQTSTLVSILAWVLPIIIFVVAVFLAFATGTSWGTFSILVPIVCHAFPEGEMLVVSIAACLSGAVCGDHCSPISDTTIMASAGAHCSHVNHVSTQLPYAMTAAAISAGCYLLCGAAQAVLGDAANTLTSFVLLACAIAIELVVLSIVRARMGHTGKEEVTKS